MRHAHSTTLAPARSGNANSISSHGKASAFFLVTHDITENTVCKHHNLCTSTNIVKINSMQQSTHKQHFVI
jgi:hypothetical protein